MLALSACAGPRGPVAQPWLPGGAVPATLNGRPLPALPADRPLRLLLLGHLYGDPAGTEPLADTVRTALPELIGLGADVWYCLGDAVRSSHPLAMGPVLDVLDEVPVPVCNALGNHELAAGSGYVERFGPAHAAVRLGPALLIQVDTESVPWELGPVQFAFLRRALERAAESPQVKVVFVLGHKLVFAHRKRYLEILAGANARDGLAGPNRFAAEILPLFLRLRPDQHAFWCAGDVGTAHSLPLFFDREPGRRLSWLATGVGDLPRDMVVFAEVAPDGAVRLAAVRLQDGERVALDGFGPAHWRRALFPDGLPPGVEGLRARLPD